MPDPQHDRGPWVKAGLGLLEVKSLESSGKSDSFTSNALLLLLVTAELGLSREDVEGLVAL